jgi:uncharacterized protein YndB with AHSA1/START domain
MITLDFKIEIKAPKEKVWSVLWDDATYRQWTAAFCEGTYAVSNWNEGDKIHFLSPSGEGMNSVIYKKIPNEYIAFKHISVLKDFKEMPVDPETEVWSGSMETYRLTQNKDLTVLEVKMDTIEKYVDYFKTTFPKGLDLVKQLSEKK